MVSLIIEYVVFGIVILGVFSYNIYNTVIKARNSTKHDYVFARGSKQVSIWSMLLSIARGFLGVRVFLGYPSEFFYRGSEMWETMYGIVIAFPLVAYLIVPVYFSLGITSVYQYLDLRFKSRLVRCLASGTYILRNTLNLGVTLFTPCVALKTIVGLPYWSSIIGISIVGIFFTIKGDLLSVVAADVVQSLAMIFCSIVVIFQGVIEAKGPVNVVKIAEERGRLNFFNFDLDPTKRLTTVTAIIGQLFMALSLYGCQQNFVQRYISLKTQKRVNKTLWLNVPFMMILFSLSWIVGMVVFANYADCDPKSLGYISNIDEILPFYIEDKFAFMPGFLGLTLACLFNGSLSFYVSNLNSLSVVIWEDFVSLWPSLKNPTDQQQLIIMKSCAAIIGIFVMFMAFAVSQFSGVIESSMLMTSATSGPLLGIFILAMFIPMANWKGASVGMIAAHLITLWITVGSFTTEKPPIKYLPTSTSGCSNSSFNKVVYHYHGRLNGSQQSMMNLFNDTEYDYDIQSNSDRMDYEVTPAPSDDFFSLLFKMTYMYYAMIGTLLTVFIGIIVSYVTGGEKNTEHSENLIHPLARKFCSWLRGENEICYEHENDSSKQISIVGKTKAANEDASKLKVPVTMTNEKSV